MGKRQLKRVTGAKVTPEKAAEYKRIREGAEKDFPPKKRKPLPGGIAGRLRRARKAQGLSLYAVAKLAGIPNPDTIRAMEEGERDARLSNVEAIAAALGLTLDLTEKV